MRQLLNKARPSSPVYDIRYRFMRPSPFDKARANKKNIDGKIHSAREMEIITVEQDFTLIMA